MVAPVVRRMRRYDLFDNAGVVVILPPCPVRRRRMFLEPALTVNAVAAENLAMTRLDEMV